jgi:GT2 family glycosyltransferase
MNSVFYQNEISIIIVNYNAGILLMNCVRSLTDYVKIKCEIIIVDNNSTDNSLAFLEKMSINGNIRVIKNKLNLGFARANNIGAKIATGKYFHFLNPDTIVTSKINLDYLKILSKNSNSIYVNKILNLDNSIEQSRNLIPLIRNYLVALISPDRAVYWYTGATLIISNSDFIKIAGWSEDYFMYSEDMDLFYKASINRIKTVELTNPIIHIGKGCTSNVWSNVEREKRVQKSFKLFYTKYNRRYEFYIIKMILKLYALVNPR